MIPRSKFATRAKLLQTARRMVIDGGLRALRINALGKRAGVDKVLIYRYFDSIEGVFEAIAEGEELWPRWSWFEETYLKIQSDPAHDPRVILFAEALKGYVESLWSRPLSLRLFGEAVGAIDPNPLYLRYVQEREAFEKVLLRTLAQKGIPQEALSYFPVITSGLVYQHLNARLEHPSRLRQHCLVFAQGMIHSNGKAKPHTDG